MWFYWPAVMKLWPGEVIFRKENQFLLEQYFDWPNALPITEATTLGVREGVAVLFSHTERQ